jgi:hypothetical protein
MRFGIGNAEVDVSERAGAEPLRLASKPGSDVGFSRRCAQPVFPGSGAIHRSIARFARYCSAKLPDNPFCIVAAARID